MKIKNFIWDFDGTLVNSYPHTFAVLWQVLEEAGLTATLDRELLMRHLLHSFASMREYSGIPDDVFHKFARRQARTDDDVLPRVVPFPDSRDVLRAVISHGGHNFLYTHRGEETRYYLDKFGLTLYFTDILTAREGFLPKPAPDTVLAIITRNSLIPDECIMIGDREIDGLAGKNAGISGALVNYPPHLPDGTCPADVSVLDYRAGNLTAFARQMGLM